ncbi:MAG: SWIM zinc finger family protein [Vulcanimicrobiaceae bacterium]
MSRRSWDWPPRTKPRRVEGGIKAQTKRGAFGQRWWAKRWIAVLEGFQLGTRLTRGRAYARAGQVVDVALELGGARASVQGSRAKPYQVTIRMRELTAREWRDVGAAISANTRLAAMLLAGEMPEDIETAFAAAGTTLFPKTAQELKTACSCPDWSNPCKHVAAVFYLIGEEFDRDPFLLFVVRGLAREAVRELLAPEASADARPAAGLRGKRVVTRSTAKRSAAKGDDEPAATPPAETTAAAFWGDEPSADAAAACERKIAAPALAAVLLRKAGRFPFWRADVAIEEALSPLYVRAAEAALAWLAEHAES